MSFGVIVSARTAPPPVNSASRCGTAHVAIPAVSGPTTPVLLNTLNDFVTNYGARTGISIPSYDWFDCFFREGGRKAYACRYTTTAYNAALTALLGDGGGPGQVAVVGITPSSGLFTDMQSHAAASVNRWAVRDVNLNDSVAAMTTVGGLAPALDDLGATFGPWVTMPAPAGVVGGTTRQVPASAWICGQANNVENNGNPNRAIAGADYPSNYAYDVAVQGILDTDRVNLFTAGVNTIAVVNGVLQGYGFQSNIPQTSSGVTPYWQANVSRLRMFLKDRATIRAQPYMFRPYSDGLANSLKGDLDEEFLLLFGRNAFNGATQQQAFNVIVSPSINTTGTIANGELHAVAEFIPAMAVKSVFVDLVTVPIGAPL